MTVIISSLLEEAGFLHGFGSRLTTENDLPSPIHILLQVHGKRIVWLAEQKMQVQGPKSKVQGINPNLIFRGVPEKPFRFGEGDALITSLPGISIGIRTADCLPALLADPASNTVAAVHCGWRSLALDLAGEAVEAMVSMTGNGPSGFLAALGPAINACCYEVGPEVIEQFRGYDPNGEFFTEREGSHFLNLRAIAKSQLLRAGVPSDHVDDLTECSACQPELFYSHRGRRDTGRMVSYIQARK
jgi:YfiH family protein